jgi:hypothetical protein
MCELYGVHHETRELTRSAPVLGFDPPAPVISGVRFCSFGRSLSSSLVRATTLKLCKRSLPDPVKSVMAPNSAVDRRGREPLLAC